MGGTNGGGTAATFEELSTARRCSQVRIELFMRPISPLLYSMLILTAVLQWLQKPCYGFMQ